MLSNHSCVRAMKYARVSFATRPLYTASLAVMLVVLPELS